MSRIGIGVLVVLSGILGSGAGLALAQTATVSVTREENKPKTVEVKVGQEVQFINKSGGTAHIMFAGNDALMFYVGKGESRIKFEKPGTYEYTVHVSGTKVHAHTGSVVVK